MQYTLSRIYRWVSLCWYAYPFLPIWVRIIRWSTTGHPRISNKFPRPYEPHVCWWTFWKLLLVLIMTYYLLGAKLASQITNIRLFEPLFVQVQIKENIKDRAAGLQEGNSRVTAEFPAERASNAEYVPIWWCHHWYLILNNCSFHIV